MRGFTDWESYEDYVDALEELADRHEPVLVTCDHRNFSEVYTITSEAWLRCDDCGAERRAS